MKPYNYFLFISILFVSSFQTQAATSKYYIHKYQEVNVNLIDMRGQLVKPLLSGFHIAGQHQHTIETQALTAGQYLIRLQSKNQQQTLKMIVSH